MFATVTNTTVEIVVSEHVFGSVYGEDGGNLDRIRQVLNYFLNKDYIICGEFLINNMIFNNLIKRCL